jgi:cyclopropane-fatty-acyl-phospholipid synthase
MTIADIRPVNPELEAIRHHYEVSNAFYRLLLGPMMMYSGGYWHDGEDLRANHDLAQERKLDAFVELAGAAGAKRVLDIGSGWGTMLDRVTTCTVPEQAVGSDAEPDPEEFVDALNNPKIEIRVESWEDHRTDERAQPHIPASTRWSDRLASLSPKSIWYLTFFEHVPPLRQGAGPVPPMTAERLRSAVSCS